MSKLKIRRRKELKMGRNPSKVTALTRYGYRK
jgi:hypothetical protein